MRHYSLILALLLLAPFCNYAQDYYINKDTTINNTWTLPKGALLKFGSKGKISGNGTIKGGIIDAALTQWIFAVTLTIKPEATYGPCFSARWFGAGYQDDNAAALQKGINTVIDNPGVLRNFFIPAGVYRFGTSLTIKGIYKGIYVGTMIHMYGESAFWDCCDGTTLQYTATTGFALGLQLNKGTEIDHLIVKGMFEAPQKPDAEYYSIPFERFTDQNGKCGSQYAGIVIDYDNSKNNGGSTGVNIHDVSVGNFTIDFLISPNGKTFNADILLFENIRCGDAQVGFATGQAQEKGNVIRGIYGWGFIHTLYSSGRYGKAQAGNYLIDGGNIAGHCIRLFDISQGGWYSTTVRNLYTESIGTLGTISTQIPTAIDNCTFHFVSAATIGKKVLFTGNNKMISFNNCIFRHYGSKESMQFAGQATFNNCFFSGPQLK